MSLLYAVLAQDPATPAPLLRRLHRFALDELGKNPMRTAWSTHPAAPVLVGLVANPALPADLLEQLAASRLLPVRRALLERPDVDAAAAVRLLGADKRSAVLRHAIAVVDDPEGVLAAHVNAVAQAGWVWSDVLLSARTSEAARIDAARRLAARDVKKTVAARITRLARRHPDLLDDLAGSTPSDALREQLVGLARRRDAQRVRPPVPGRVSRAALSAWLAAPDRRSADVVAYVRAEPRPLLVRTAVSDFADPDGVVAAAALQHCPDRVVASAVQAVSGLPLALRRRAGLIVADTGSGLSSDLAAPLLELVAADAAYASAVVEVCRDYRILKACTVHGDLSPAAVAAIGHGLRHVAGLRGSRALRSWLSTHPNAAVADRRWAIAELEQEVRVAAAGADPARQRSLADELAWARAALAAQTDGPAMAGAALPCDLVRRTTNWHDQPGRVRLVSAALAAQLDGLDAEGAAHVLVALADTFTGTLGELGATAAAVAC